MINKFLLSTVAIVAIAGSAFAADLPSRRAPPVYVPPPIPVFSWTGAYVGGQIGYAFGTDKLSASLGGLTVPVTSANPSGIIGGAHIGYNFAPIGGGLLVGLEGDVDGSDYQKTFFGVVKTALPIQGSVRGRLGFAFDRALFYATGGAAFGSFTNSYFLPAGTVKLTTSRVGYTVGGGVEYAITNNWSLRAEYRYSDFGTVRDGLLNGNAATFTINHKEIEQRAQIGASYKFDTILPAPVVAKY